MSWMAMSLIIPISATRPGTKGPNLRADPKTNSPTFPWSIIWAAVLTDGLNRSTKPTISSTFAAFAASIIL